MHRVLNYDKGQEVINYWRSSLTNLHYSKVLFHFPLFLFFFTVCLRYLHLELVVCYPYAFHSSSQSHDMNK